MLLKWCQMTISLKNRTKERGSEFKWGHCVAGLPWSSLNLQKMSKNINSRDIQWFKQIKKEHQFQQLSSSVLTSHSSPSKSPPKCIQTTVHCYQFQNKVIWKIFFYCKIFPSGFASHEFLVFFFIYFQHFLSKSTLDMCEWYNKRVWNFTYCFPIPHFPPRSLFHIHKYFATFSLEGTIHDGGWKGWKLTSGI